jgi:hypothetical protein
MNPTVSIKYNINPIMNIGFLPTMSAILGNINEPMNVPIKNVDPINPIYTLLAQVKSIYSTQLFKLSISDVFT